MRDSVHQIKKYVGHTIATLIVELYLYEDENSPTINDIEITFDNGISFILGCSGEGGISIRKGKARVNTELDGILRAELIEFNYVSGSKLGAVDETDDSLVLGAGSERLVIENNDDELVMRLNDKEVQISF